MVASTPSNNFTGTLMYPSDLTPSESTILCLSTLSPYCLFNSSAIFLVVTEPKRRPSVPALAEISTTVLSSSIWTLIFLASSFSAS